MTYISGYLHDVTETRILNEDMYASMARQKLTRGYCLTHYYVRIVSLFPSSYVHLRRFAVNFFTPISEQVSGVPACSLLTWRHRDKNSKWRYICVYGTAKNFNKVLFDPLLCKNSFIIPSSYVHLRNVAMKFLYRISEPASGVPACSLLKWRHRDKNSKRRYIWSMAQQKHWLGIDWTPFE